MRSVAVCVKMTPTKAVPRREQHWPPTDSTREIFLAPYISEQNSFYPDVAKLMKPRAGYIFILTYLSLRFYSFWLTNPYRIDPCRSFHWTYDSMEYLEENWTWSCFSVCMWRFARNVCMYIHESFSACEWMYRAVQEIRYSRMRTPEVSLLLLVEQVELACSFK